MVIKRKVKVLHFVTGGFSGATRVAVDLVSAHQQCENIETLLVMRRKKSTSADKLTQLHNKSIPFRLVDGAMHWITIYQLSRICKEWQPDVLVAHGFPEHLLGRWAGLWAKVPHLVQIEHNSRERYTPWKLWQTRYLSRFTARVIGVSEGVADGLRSQNLKADIMAIPNGIDTERFAQGKLIPLLSRAKDIVMVGRFAKSKDQISLVRALAILKKNGLKPSLTLVGGGNKRYAKRAHDLVKALELADQVTFIEHSDKVEQILAEHKIFVMASFFEGLNLSVLEAMAAGCLVVGSDAVGVSELINDGEDGFLFTVGDPHSLAKRLISVLDNINNCQFMANAGREKAQLYYNKQRVSLDYKNVFINLVQDDFMHLNMADSE